MGDVALVAWVWLALVTFVLGCAWRAWRYASAPEHLRWDLYPVAHEPAARRAYGGSHLEEREHWTKPREKSLVGEVTAMLEEIVFLRGVWRHNRRVFWGSLPFHWGLYLLIGATALLVPAAAGFAPDWLVVFLDALAFAGGALVLAGAGRLLVLRTTDPGLKRYSAPLDRLNLALFAALGALTLAIPWSGEGMSDVSRAVAAAAVFQPSPVPALVAAQMLLAGLIAAYLPFTRMVHFFAKYFLYHDVRWDDRPLEAGSAMERRLRAALDYGVSWSADHVGAGRTWAEVATSNPSSARKQP